MGIRSRPFFWFRMRRSASSSSHTAPCLHIEFFQIVTVRLRLTAPSVRQVRPASAFPVRRKFPGSYTLLRATAFRNILRRRL